MPDSTSTQCLLFSDLYQRPLVLAFDQRQGSSDGGAVLLQAANRRYGLIESMSACLPDRRQAGKGEHRLVELLRQRIHGLACGYPDANDAARLEADPIHKLLVGRDPLSGRDLASQPTLSRFENAAGPQALYCMGMELASCVIERHGKRLGGHARRVTIDLDPTDDATHGAQQLSFFNAHYDNWCYLPMMGFVSFDDESDQYLCAAVLRPGNVTATAGAVGVLRRLIRMVRARFSPRLLLEIDLTVPAPELPWIVHEDLPERKFAEFRNRCIGNSFKEIIFSDKQVLLDWLVSEELAARIATLKDPARNQECMWESTLRTNYGLSGFGRVPKEFESLLAKGSLDLSRP